MALDAPTLVAAASELSPGALVFPQKYPPGAGAVNADAIGVFVYDDDYFGLVLTEAVLDTVTTTLIGALGWDDEQAAHYVELLVAGAKDSGGGVVTSNSRANFLGGLDESATTAARGLVGPELAPSRILVTRCADAVRAKDIMVRGVALPPQTTITALSPGDFLSRVKTVRWRMRQSGARH